MDRRRLEGEDWPGLFLRRVGRHGNKWYSISQIFLNRFPEYCHAQSQISSMIYRFSVSSHLLSGPGDNAGKYLKHEKLIDLGAHCTIFHFTSKGFTS